MADDLLQADSACANPDGRSIARMASNDFDGIGVYIEQAAALVNVMADADGMDNRCRNALCSVSDLLEYRAAAVRETVEKYLAASRESFGAEEPNPGETAWQAARDLETLAGQVEDASAPINLLARADSIDVLERNAVGAVADLLDFIRGDVSKIEAKFDAIGKAVLFANGGNVAQFKRP